MSKTEQENKKKGGAIPVHDAPEEACEEMGYRHRDAGRAKDTRRMRILAAIAFPLAGLAVAWFFWKMDPSGPEAGVFHLFCPFNKLTGLYCPGCGMTRAAHELTHLNILAGIRYNPLVVLLIGPTVAVMGFGEYVNYVSGKTLWKPVRIGKRTLYLLVALVLLFTVLRNIPVFPFTLLAPPA